MLSSKKSFFLFLLVLIFQNACSAEKPASELFNNLPQNVLIGTDVQPINEYKSLGRINTGHYFAEMGGATLKLVIKNDPDQFKITRIFQEAGRSEEIKNYKFEGQGNQAINNSDISLILTKKGLLVLEKKPDNFGIPTDLWIMYSVK